ncbi:hypothetical protein DPMN_152274 [Dreissena polymorpha]|uniref:RING-type domain-containing protein n=1 Tax=Dreissena polymorpha TaxID=45954 RepID=A0A9D4FI03_DREPO|nr:hypothetical protein DPMN_152274 [Dreissena polymorpha]
MHEYLYFEQCRITDITRPAACKLQEAAMYARQQFDIIQCKLCNNIYTDPRLLECLHSFCFDCIKSYMPECSSLQNAVIQCPLCQEETQLVNYKEGLVQNTLLNKLLAQTQKDTTSIVASKEVVKMSHETLTETERKCPEIVASIEEIASIAGQIVADNNRISDQASDVATAKTKQDVKSRTSQLQFRAMDLVHSIDSVNETVKDYVDKKVELREAIKHRSLEIQDAVRTIERQLITRLENRENENATRDEAFRVKNKLHTILRSNLTMVDFLRLLTDYGDKKDLGMYSEIIQERENKLFSSPVTVSARRYTFEHCNKDIQSEIENLFGSLSEVTLDRVVWNPRKEITKNYIDHNDTELKHLENDRADDLRTSQTDAGHHSVSDFNMSSDMQQTSWLAVRQPPGSGKQTGRGKLLQKSMSFDIPSLSPYHYITSANQPLYDRAIFESKNKASDQDFQILNEKDGDITPSTSGNVIDTNEAAGNIRTAIDTLQSTSHFHQYRGHRSRRVSAPSSTAILDALNRRRLNALSILERANINTASLNVSTDIEAGMNEARQEWMKEGIRRRMERRLSKEEGV